MHFLHSSIILFKETFHDWRRHNVSWLAAAVAFYTLFSLAPTFVVMTTIGGKIFGEESVKGIIVEQLETLMGLKTAIAIQKMIEAGQNLTIGTFPKIVTIVILLIAATNVFTQLKLTLNKIWDVETPNRHWVASYLINRILSVGMILFIGIFLFALVFMDVILAGFGKILSAFVPAFTYVYIWQIGNLLVSFLIITGLFAVMYKHLPDIKIAWKDVWLGAAIASLLFTIGKFLISLYLARSRLITLFGAASSFVVILIWVYYSVQILFLGAEISQNYSTLFGSRSGKKGEAGKKAKATSSRRKQRSKQSKKHSASSGEK